MLKKPFPWFRKRPALGELGQMVQVKGRKVVLRGKRIEDAADDYSWRSDEELARLDATRPLDMTYSDFLRFSREEQAYPSPLSRRFAIDTLEGRHIGNCMYYDIDLKQGEAELGIMIGDRDYWGKGYGTDSVSCLLDHIFSGTPLTRIYLHTLDWNHRARKAFAKCGFQEVKSVRRSGEDFILMEVLRSDWTRQEHRRARETVEAAAAALDEGPGRAVELGADGRSADRGLNRVD
ncbi:MAG: GNAT family N-acetyltransferase [Chloroflexi bacterium]|nr:GNAT family N-acetyltransferase [Chloroflexota bacterium]